MRVKYKVDEYNNNNHKQILHQTILRASVMVPMTAQVPPNTVIIMPAISIIIRREETISMRKILQLHTRFCSILFIVAIHVFVFVTCLHDLLTVIMIVITKITPGVPITL